MNDNRKKDTTGPVRVGAIRGSRNFVRKYIAVLLALTMSSVASPALAGDFVNTKLLERLSPLSLEMLPTHPLKTTVRGIPSDLAFAIPQSSQDSQRPAQSPKPTKTTSGGKKWGGVVLMILGGALIARGAALSDPCDAYSSAYSCTSNYKTVRASSFGMGAAAFVSGAVLFSRR